MKRLKNHRYILLCVIFLLGTMAIPSVSYALSGSVPVVKIESPFDKNYYLQEQTVGISASISNEPDFVTYAYNNEDNYLGNLYKSSTGSYTGNWIPSSGNWAKPKLVYVNGKYQWVMNKFIVKATNTYGEGKSQIDGYVSVRNRNFYSGIDGSWYFNNSWFNSFSGVGTNYNGNECGDNEQGGYNCLAYAVDIYDRWQWPWSTTYLSQSDIETYMRNTSPQRGGTQYLNVRTSSKPYSTKVIYFSGAHFAKVVGYDSNGNPKAIISKWGGAELIYSDLSKFTGYGIPLYYID